MQTLAELFEDGLRDIYYAEKAIVKILPKMMKKAGSEHLASAFQEHAQQTEEQIERLQEIFEMIGKAPRGKRCPAIDGLTEEAMELMQEAKDETVRDAGILAAAQAVEHYEIARYGTLAAWADKLQMRRAAKLLRETLEEEKETDDKLTDLALSEINVEVEDGEIGMDDDGPRGQKGGRSGRNGDERRALSRSSGNDRRGRVRDPEHDGRLRQNRDDDDNDRRSASRSSSSTDGRGRVRDPEHDGRLRQNRDDDDDGDRLGSSRSSNQRRS
jgi:ferritin-like metal-binding protein YciE